MTAARQLVRKARLVREFLPLWSAALVRKALKLRQLKKMAGSFNSADPN